MPSLPSLNSLKQPPLKEKNPFDSFFQNSIYLEFKNHLYNYQLRKKEIRRILNTLDAHGLILEIGSGVSTIAEKGDKVIFTDLSLEAMKNLKNERAGQKALVMDVTDIAFKDKSIFTLVCSEVIEHVKDDNKALREMFRVLMPGGSLILTVPIHPAYFSSDDRFVKHERRYVVWPLLKRLRKIGFHEPKLFKIAGFLDKIAMIAATAAYSLFGSKKPLKNNGRLTPFFLKAILPFYKVINWLYSYLVRWEAKLMPLSVTSILLIHCKKPEET